jgi:hypothetical protein
MTFTCPAGHEVVPGQRYCRECGRPVSEASAIDSDDREGHSRPTEATRELPTTETAGPRLDNTVPGDFDVTRQGPASVYRQDAPRPGRPLPPPARRGPALVLGLVAMVVILAAAGVGAAVLIGGHHSSGSQSISSGSQPTTATSASTAPPTSAVPPTTGGPDTVAPGSDTVARLAAAISLSAGVRPTIQRSIDGVESCSLSAPSGIQALNQAIAVRQGIVAQLAGVPTGGLPQGGQLVAALTKAMQDSIAADTYYEGWMQDFAAAGDPCGSDPNGDSAYANGQAASAQATSDKDAFDALWNQLAVEYGQNVLTDTDY